MDPSLLKMIQLSRQVSIGIATLHSIERVTCKIAVDDKLKEVKYNDEEVIAFNDGHLPTLTGTCHLSNWCNPECCHLKIVEFTAHESPYPGHLYIKGEIGARESVARTKWQCWFIVPASKREVIGTTLHRTPNTGGTMMTKKFAPVGAHIWY